MKGIWILFGVILVLLFVIWVDVVDQATSEEGVIIRDSTALVGGYEYRYRVTNDTIFLIKKAD